MTDIERIYSYYGLNHQIDKTCEECGELIQALMKGRCNGYSAEDVANVQEELADVKIMIEQMLIPFGSINRIVEQKIKRTLDRMVKE